MKCKCPPDDGPCCGLCEEGINCQDVYGIMCSCPAHDYLVDCTSCKCDHTRDRMLQWKNRALAAEAILKKMRQEIHKQIGCDGRWESAN